MGALASVRADLKAALEAAEIVDLRDEAVPVLDVMPSALAGPAMLLRPGNPLITRGGTRHVAEFTYIITCVVEPGTNEAQDLDVEALAELVLGAVFDESHEWVFSQMGAPYDLSLPWGDRLAVDITVTRLAPITTA